MSIYGILVVSYSSKLLTTLVPLNVVILLYVRGWVYIYLGCTHSCIFKTCTCIIIVHALSYTDSPASL